MSPAITEDCIKSYRLLGFEGEPCEPSDLEQLEKKFRVRLPAAYRAYLLLMGHKPDFYFDGTDCAFRHLPGLRAGAAGLLSECGNTFALPSNAFVFLMHQGYQFMYFLCEQDSDDPAVYHYLENDEAPKIVYQRFSDWIKVCAEEKREFENRANKK